MLQPSNHERSRCHRPLLQNCSHKLTREVRLGLQPCPTSTGATPPVKMIDDQDLGFFANFLGIFIFVMVVAYHYVVADPKYD
ncbi:hypothetical protein GOP47_0017733 [Adiantum capillus-veneris]|uniref:Dolichyl-diphosphooligosaccharide--protein glycosyltransferase subunit 4A n=1 Tax=Adiantum capillus-veneris TaxID=13818 RepID=A0A9D4UG09_ADICA|nr:hypothetical protein GOP47_0017733 [Adiantum capillus-veneris]